MKTDLPAEQFTPISVLSIIVNHQTRQIVVVIMPVHVGKVP